jgi:dihydrofolate reductase
MICKNCNAEISDDLKFCPFCGAENSEEVPETDLLVTENYDEGAEETSLLVQNDVSSVSADPVPVMQPNNNIVVNEPAAVPQDAMPYVPKVNITDMVQKVEEPSQKQKKEKSPKKKKLIAIIAIVLCVAIVGGGVGAFFLGNSGKKDAEPVTYITEDGELYVVDSLGKKEAVTYLITDEYAWKGYKFSSDGKYVVYTTGDSDDEEFNIEYKKVKDDKAEPVVLVKGAETLYGANDDLSEIIYVTKVNYGYKDADTYFPNLDVMNDWAETEIGEEKDYQCLKYKFCVYERERESE